MSVARLGTKHFGRVLSLLEPWEDHENLNMLLYGILNDWEETAKREGLPVPTWELACRSWSNMNAGTYTRTYKVGARFHTLAQIRAQAHTWRKRDGDYLRNRHIARATYLLKALLCVACNSPGYGPELGGVFLDRLIRELALWIVQKSPAYEQAPWFI